MGQRKKACPALIPASQAATEKSSSRLFQCEPHKERVKDRGISKYVVCHAGDPLNIEPNMAPRWGKAALNGNRSAMFDLKALTRRLIPVASSAPRHAEDDHDGIDDEVRQLAPRSCASRVLDHRREQSQDDQGQPRDGGCQQNGFPWMQGASYQPNHRSRLLQLTASLPKVNQCHSGHVDPGNRVPGQKQKGVRSGFWE